MIPDVLVANCAFLDDLSEEEKAVFEEGYKIFNAGTHVQTDVSCNTEGQCFIIEISDKKEIHAKNLRQCPYCGQKLVFSDSEKPGVDYTYKADILEKNAKPVTAPLHPIPNANKENLAENTSSLNKNENESSEKESSTNLDIILVFPTVDSPKRTTLHT